MSSEQAQRLLDRWAPDPVLFSQEALGFEPWDLQADAMRAVAEHDHVAVRSGHKIGKSRFDAALALWWFCTRPRARVVFSATAGHQVANILWPELRDLYLKARAPLGGRLYDDYHKGLKLSDGREIFGLTTKDSESFAGISSPGLLFIVDEASGFPKPIFDAVFGNMAGGGKVVLTGNPTRTSGVFYDAFHGKRGSWCTKHIPSTAGPNFRGQNIPGLANPTWLAWARKYWGENTPAWDVRVEGNFPRGGSMNVVALYLIEDAETRWLEVESEGEAPLVAGLDPARFGDDTSVLAPRRGKKLLDLPEWRGLDGPNLAGKAREWLLDHRQRGEKPRVKVDVIGIGASAYDALRRSSDLEVVPVNSSESANDPEKFANVRAEMHFAVAGWLGEGGAICPSERLAGELAAAEYGFDPRGRYQVEPKARIKERIGRSPDAADALGLSCWDRPSGGDVLGWQAELAAAQVGSPREVAAPNRWNRPPSEREDDDDTPRGRW